MRRLLDSWRLSPIGGAVLLVLTAAVLVLAVGPEHEQTPAFIVIVAVVAIVVVRSAPFAGRWTRPTIEERREDFHPRSRDTGTGTTTTTDPSEQAEQETDWTHARERYGRG